MPFHLIFGHFLQLLWDSAKISGPLPSLAFPPLFVFGCFPVLPPTLCPARDNLCCFNCSQVVILELGLEDDFLYFSFWVNPYNNQFLNEENVTPGGDYKASKRIARMPRSFLWEPNPANTDWFYSIIQNTVRAVSSLYFFPVFLSFETPLWTGWGFALCQALGENK